MRISRRNEAATGNFVELNLSVLPLLTERFVLCLTHPRLSTQRHMHQVAMGWGSILEACPTK
jgi:hypothetical protein